MSIRLTFGGALAVFAVAAGLRAEADTAKRQMTVDDLYLIQDVSGPALSPDGKLVAYVVTGHDTEIDAAISGNPTLYASAIGMTSREHSGPGR